MSTIEITLPDHLRTVADELVASGRYASHSEYFQSLVEADQRRRGVEAMLVERLEDPRHVVMDAQDMKRTREEFLQRLAQRAAK